MKTTEFKNYDEYLRSQKRTVRRRGSGPFFCDMEITRIANWIRQNATTPQYGICHGARAGLECDEFRHHFPLLEIFGTDLFPFSGSSAKIKGKSEVIEWDFMKQNPEWVGTFDFVYTNSLDHTLDPNKALSLWIDQLKKDGHLFVQWVYGHIGKRKGGDCTGGELSEFMIEMNKIGRLVDLLYTKIGWMRGNRLRYKGTETVVLVVGKK